MRLREPMILGHEVAGRIVALGEGVEGVAVGDRVAVSPSRPCAACEYCLAGLPNQCLNMRFYGSAMPFPHIQGAFRQRLVAWRASATRWPRASRSARRHSAEPFAVTLHAVARAGSLLDRRVLVSGCGPIGAPRSSRRVRTGRGRSSRPTWSTACSIRGALGADRTINVARDRGARRLRHRQGQLRLAVEASGNEGAVRAGLEVLRPRGVLVQLGLGGDIAIPQNLVVAKEIEIRGTFRFHSEFALAVDLINRRRVDLKPLLSGTYPLEEAVPAFEAAGDRSRSMKVQLAF